jgi:hypothetical protein
MKPWFMKPSSSREDLDIKYMQGIHLSTDNALDLTAGTKAGQQDLSVARVNGLQSRRLHKPQAEVLDLSLSRLGSGVNEKIGQDKEVIFNASSRGIN